MDFKNKTFRGKVYFILGLILLAPSIVLMGGGFLVLVARLACKMPGSLAVAVSFMIAAVGGVALLLKSSDYP